MEPIEIKSLDDELSQRIKKNCKPGLMPAAGIEVYPSGVCMPSGFPVYAERLRTFHVRQDDIWCISYPKCGTTWTQEMVWLLTNNLDFKTAKENILSQRSPFFEARSLITQDFVIKELLFDNMSFCDALPSPRVIKTHLPVKLLPLEIWTRKPKVVYVTRDPKDVVTSYYHHYRLWNGYTGTLEDMIEGFLQDKLVYSPFWEHVAEYKKIAQLPNVLIISYEDMITDLAAVIRRVADFIERSYTDAEVQSLANHLNFSNMKKNSSTNINELVEDLKEKNGLSKEDPDLAFIRKGKSGGYRDAMSPELIERFDRWSADKKKELGI